MAIATFERDPARDTGKPELRFRLLQEVCHVADAGFWRALDRRSGKTCVVRVIDADREQSSRRLGDLHRERTLAERIGHPAVLRADVPTIEDDRIFQVVDPEPARGVEGEAEGGRLAILNLLVAASAVLVDAHARGVFHGAFSRASCLRTSEGRLLVHGFLGDAASAAAIRDGAAADHRAFLEFATEMLRNSGGAPPRLRRYFNQHLADDAPNPAPAAMAGLSADLRESLEDTFPWPLAAAAAAAAADFALPQRAATPWSSTHESPTLTLPKLDAQIAIAASAPAFVPAPARAADPALAPPPASAAAPVLAIVPPPVRAVETTPIRAPTSSGAAPIAAPAAGLRSPPPAPTEKPAGLRQPDAASEASSSPPEAPPTRSLRPWLAAVIVIVIVAAALHYGSKPVGAPPAAVIALPGDVPTRAPQGEIAPTLSDAAAAAPATVASQQPAAASPRVAAAAPGREEAVAPATRAVQRAVVVSPQQATPRRDAMTVAPPVDPAAPSPQAIRSRVATLVAGGNRALTALEPDAAAEAFTAALAVSPNDRAALEGSQRARRLQGVAALMRDASEASARGDHARAVQGYSQALSNNPRNRGLADALASARRSLGRDATSALLAEGHAALGAGRFEAARAAFEKALQADPTASGARRAAEQASTAILLRDAAAERRATVALNEG